MTISIPDPDDFYEWSDDEPDPEAMRQDDERRQGLTAADRNPSMLDR